MTVRVLFLGPARDWSGTPEASADLEPHSDVRALRKWLAREFPELQDRLSRIRIAVNQSFAQDEDRLDSGDEVALIPPVSGG